MARAWAWLSAAERLRAERFVFAKDREAWVAGRGALRALVGAAQGRSPGAVALDLGPQGKPFTPEGPAFNLSHSGDQALLVLHPQGPVGVDLEALRPLPELEGLATMVLGPQELARWGAWRRRSVEAAEEAFLRAWVAKEALLKAWGLGLHREAASVELPWWPELSEGSWAEPGQGAWRVGALAGPGFVGAIAWPEALGQVALGPPELLNWESLGMT